MEVRDPLSADEWQQAVDLAEMHLRLDSARQYGLITGGAVVNVDRCLELLAAGRARGIAPTAAGVDRALQLELAYRLTAAELGKKPRPHA
jgi:hypothetical protein